MKTGSAESVVAPHALRLRIGLDQRDAVFGAAGHGEIADGLGVDREEAAGRAIFRRHVADGGAVGQRHVGEAGAEELDELADHALLAQHLGDGQHEVGGGDAFLQLAGQAEADDFGQQHRDGLAEHRGLGLDAADAPAEHAEAVDHGGVGIGADAGVGIGDDVAVLAGLVHTVWPRYSRLTWWQMPVPGGTTRKLRNACWPHFRNL